MTKEPSPAERQSYQASATLRLHDVRYDPHDIAHCNPLPDGRVQLRIQTEHAIIGGRLLVYDDGTLHTLDLQQLHDCSRWRYWEVLLTPRQPRLGYSFHLLTARGRPYYVGGRGLTSAVETRFELDLSQQPPTTPPDWSQHAAIYQIFPDRFCNGDPDLPLPPGRQVAWGSAPRPATFQGGDLVGITQKIDHIHALGCQAIYLNPIFQSPSNHKYDATDFYRVDESLGGNQALRNLVDSAHARGMKVILDASFNHAHPTFFAFQDVVQRGPKSDYWDWFTVYQWPVSINYRPHVVPPGWDTPAMREYTAYLREIEQQAQIPFVQQDDAGDLFEPNYMAWYDVINMPKLNLHTPACRQYFLEVATHWLTEFDVDGWRMDVAQFVPDDFWQDFRRVCKAAQPDCYLLAEIWGDASHWLQGDMFDGTMNYLFRDLAIDFFADLTLHPADLRDGLLRLDALYAPQVAAANQNLLSSHDVARFLHRAGGSKTKLGLATIFQCALPGAPGIYYGDEVGLSGGGDPANRGAFPWDESTWDRGQLDLTRTLVQLRESHPALRGGRLRWLTAGKHAFALERASDQEKIIVAINRGPRAEKLPLPTAGFEKIFCFGKPATSRRGQLRLAPQSAVILRPSSAP